MTMADRKAKCSLRNILERQLVKVNYFELSKENMSETLRNAIVDNIIKEFNRVGDLRKLLSKIENETDVRVRHFNLQFIVRGIVDYICYYEDGNLHPLLEFDEDGSIKNMHELIFRGWKYAAGMMSRLVYNGEM